jgi:DNA-binding MarR family transcriptional regulator
VNVLATLRSVGSPFELRPTGLQARLLLSSGGISNVLNRLERNGLVERQRDSNDGRSCWVRLTGEGAKLAYAFARVLRRRRGGSWAGGAWLWSS